MIIVATNKCIFCNAPAKYFSGHIHTYKYGIVEAGFCEKHNSEEYKEDIRKNIEPVDCEYNGNGCYGKLDKVSVFVKYKDETFIYFNENGKAEEVSYG